MHVPSRVEVLSWNENQVADLLREHHLLDCVDCIYQRHIDGQKLLNLREGDVMYFLEIHDQKSRGKLWGIVKRIAEKKGGVQNLMRNFQSSVQPEVEEDHQNDFYDESDDSFDSEYDEPDEPENNAPAASGTRNPGGISLARQETIKKNLMGLIAPKPAFEESNEVDNDNDNEDIYDVPEEGYGVPDDDGDMYDVPSDESGGGVVQHGGKKPFVRVQSDQYLKPDDSALIQHMEDGEQDYEDLNGCPPNLGAPSYFDGQEDYVVPDMKPPATKIADVPPVRPPKPPGNNNHKPPPPKIPTSEKEPGGGQAHPKLINKMRAKFEEQSYEPPEPQRGLKKPAFKKPPPELHPTKDNLSRSPQPSRFPSKPEKKALKAPDEPDNYELPEVPQPTKKTKEKAPPVVQENYEPPPQPARPNKKPVSEPEQQSYEPPVQPPKLKNHKNLSPSKKPVAEIEQDTYLPPRPEKKLFQKPPMTQPEPVQENYEPPEPSWRNKPVTSSGPAKPPVIEETYEPIDGSSHGQEKGSEFVQEDYELPSKPDAIEEPPKLHGRSFNPKAFFSRSSKNTPPSAPASPDRKIGKRNSLGGSPKKEAQPPPKPPVNSNKGKGFFGKNKSSVDPRSSMALPSLPSETVESSPPSQSRTSPSVPRKPLPSPDGPRKPLLSPDGPRKPLLSPDGPRKLPPSPERARKPPPSPERSLLHEKAPPLPASRPRAEIPSRSPSKTKEQLLQDRPWFHGSIAKTAVAGMLKSTKKDGAYLVRNSSRDPGKYIMSIYYKSDIRHLNIPSENGEYRLGDSGTEKFRSIEELVKYFTRHDVEFSAGGKTPLTHACVKNS